MTGWQALGGLLVLIPFVVLVIVMVADIGWRAVAIIWAGVFGVAAIVVLGSLLISGELP